MIDRLTTASVAEQQRLDYWMSSCSRVIGGFALGDYQPDNFFAEVDLFAVADLKIGRYESVAQSQDRKRSLIKSWDTDDYLVILESEKTFTLDQGGRQRAGRGGISLLDVAQPFFTGHPEGVDVVDIFIPRRKLEAVFGSARQAAGLGIDTTQPSFPVLSAFLRSLATHGTALDPASAGRMSAIAIDLIAAGFAERMGQEPALHPANASTLFRARAYIDANLGTSGLGMQDVAAAVNVSIRRLHQIALEDGISLIDWMWQRRLSRARSMLIDPAYRALSISGIAYACGFLDQAHFSRRFKDAFGETPTECRQSANPAAPPGGKEDGEN